MLKTLSKITVKYNLNRFLNQFDFNVFPNPRWNHLKKYKTWMASLISPKFYHEALPLPW